MKSRGIQIQLRPTPRNRDVRDATMTGTVHGIT
jgi:hypothetical protein